MSETERDRAAQDVGDDELAAEHAVELPDREALSVVDPYAGGAVVRPYLPYVHHPPLLADPPPIVDPVEPTPGPR